MGDDDWQGLRCICGEFVVTLHRECRGNMTAEQIEFYTK